MDGKFHSSFLLLLFIEGGGDDAPSNPPDSASSSGLPNNMSAGVPPTVKSPSKYL